jgi:anti-anti-sigma factor
MIEKNVESERVLNNLVFRRAFIGNRCKLSLLGELKHGDSEGLYREVIGLFDSGVNDLLLDFTSLDYVDTAGLQSLVRIYKYVSDNGGLTFRMLVLEGELLEILRTCRFDRFIDITQDRSLAEGDWR